MFKIAFVVAVLLAAVSARPSDPYGPPPQSYPDTPAQYDFKYAVKDDYSRNDYNHGESRNGYDTKGSYQVLLPDGKIQTVEYTVSKDSGFVANVVAQG
ncbi:hypothetical protein SK128_003613 [Halocaridina rubra]|uniref:Cuticle protein n=1 Tax=Halocaridina rubra TaxID=373956 RepID=A0AAN8WVL0_HALRR